MEHSKLAIKVCKLKGYNLSVEGIGRATFSVKNGLKG